MADKNVGFGVKKDNNKFTPELYNAYASALHARVAALHSYTESEGIPLDDGALLEDGSFNPDFDEAIVIVLEDAEKVAKEFVEIAAGLRSKINNRPKPAPETVDIGGGE